MSIEDTGFKPDTDRKTAGCCVNKMKPGYKERLRMYQPAAVKDPLLTCIKGDKFRFIVLSHYYNRFSCFNAKKKSFLILSSVAGSRNTVLASVPLRTLSVFLHWRSLSFSTQTPEYNV